MASYYAGKNYILRLTEAIDMELRQTGSRVRVCALCPGPVDTPFHDRAQIRQAVRGLSPRQVAKAGLDGVFGKKTIVLPGITTKTAHLFQRFLPEEMLLRINYAIQKRKEG